MNDNDIKFLSDKLNDFVSKHNIPLGLQNGKMGLCIYYYILYRYFGSKSDKVNAENLLNDIITNVYTIKNNIDLKDGIAGIGLGITFLVKHKYINADLNTSLEEIDDFIIKRIIYNIHNLYNDYDSITLLHLLYYFSIRLETQKRKSYSEKIYQEIIINLLNVIYEKLFYSSLYTEKSFVYKADYEVPIFLYLLGVIWKYDFYNYKIESILNECEASLCSMYPFLNSNRLYLLWGINNINRIYHSEALVSHSNFLKANINIYDILNKELKDKNIYFNNGICSIYFLYKDTMHDLFPINEELFINKIVKSEAWDMLVKNSLYFKKHIGLFDGLCGSILTVYALKHKINAEYRLL